MQNEHKILSEIQSEILMYLEEHPDAADTIEGVRQWWLFQRMAAYSRDKVLVALDRLRNEGLIEAVTLSDGQKVFSLPESGRRREPSIVSVKTQEAKS